MVLNSTIRQVVFWVVIIGGAILLYRYFHNPTTTQPKQLSYSELASRVESPTREIESAVIEKEKVTGKFAPSAGGGTYTTDLTNDFTADKLVDLMRKNGVKIDFKN